MTEFDYAVVGIIAASVLLGWWRGVVSEALALAAWIVAFLVAQWGAVYLLPWVPERTSPELRLIVAWGASFLLVLLLFALVRIGLSLLLKAVGLGWLDRLLGACFGVARGVLVVLALVLVCGLTPLPKAQWWREAILAPPLVTVVLAARPWLPREFVRRLDYR